jgi:hypothetical protein
MTHVLPSQEKTKYLYTPQAGSSATPYPGIFRPTDGGRVVGAGLVALAPVFFSSFDLAGQAGASLDTL